jgi:flavodoxin
MADKGLIAFFSWVGNTAAVMREAQAVTGFDVVEIKERVPRRQGNIPRAGFDSMRGYLSPLEPMDFAMHGYDRVLFGAQVWAGRISPPIKSFLAQADFSGKRVWVVVTRSDPKKQPEAIEFIRAQIEAKGGTFMDGITINTQVNSVVPLEKFQAELHEWLKRNGLWGTPASSQPS